MLFQNWLSGLSTGVLCFRRSQFAASRRSRRLGQANHLPLLERLETRVLPATFSTGGGLSLATQADDATLDISFVDSTHVQFVLGGPAGEVWSGADDPGSGVTGNGLNTLTLDTSVFSGFLVVGTENTNGAAVTIYGAGDSQAFPFDDIEMHLGGSTSSLTFTGLATRLQNRAVFLVGSRGFGIYDEPVPGLERVEFEAPLIVGSLLQFDVQGHLQINQPITIESRGQSGGDATFRAETLTVNADITTVDHDGIGGKSITSGIRLYSSTDIFLNATVSTGSTTTAVPDDGFSGPYSGPILVSTGSADIAGGVPGSLIGNANGRLVTGSARHTNAGPSYSGEVQILARDGGVQLAAMDAIVTGEAVSDLVDNARSATTSGSIIIQSRDGISSNGAAGHLSLALGTAFSAPGAGFDNAGHGGLEFGFSDQTSTNRGGNVYITSSGIMRVHQALTDENSAQTVDIESTGSQLVLGLTTEPQFNRGLAGDQTTFRVSSEGGLLDWRIHSQYPRDFGDGSLTVIADDLKMAFTIGSPEEVPMPDSIIGTGSVLIRPFSDDRSIILGETTGDEGLQISKDELLSFQNGFSHVTIGSPAMNGPVLLTGDVILADNTTIYGSEITQAGSGTLIASENLTLDASAGAIGTNGSVRVDVTGDLSLTADAPDGLGDIRVFSLKAIDLGGPGLTITTGSGFDSIELGSEISISVTANATLNDELSLVAVGAVTFEDGVALTSRSNFVQGASVRTKPGSSLISTSGDTTIATHNLTLAPASLVGSNDLVLLPTSGTISLGAPSIGNLSITDEVLDGIQPGFFAVQIGFKSYGNEYQVRLNDDLTLRDRTSIYGGEFLGSGGTLASSLPLDLVASLGIGTSLSRVQLDVTGPLSLVALDDIFVTSPQSLDIGGSGVSISIGRPGKTVDLQSTAGNINVIGDLALNQHVKLNAAGAVAVSNGATLSARSLVAKGVQGITTAGSGKLRTTAGDMLLHTTGKAIGTESSPVNVEVNGGMLSIVTEAPGGADGDVFIASLGTLAINTLSTGPDPDVVSISSGGNITFASPISVNDNVGITVAGNVNLAFGGTLQTQSISVTAPNGIQGGGTVQSTATSGPGIVLVTVNGGIGSNGVPIDVLLANGGKLVTTSSGEQFVATVGTVAIDTLNAGSSTVNLSGGTFTLTSDDGIANTSTLAIQTDATLDLQTFNEIINQLEIKGGTILEGSGSLSIQAGTVLIAGTASGVSGIGGCLIPPEGSGTLSGSNVFNGPITVAGTVALDTTSNANGTAVEVQSGGTLKGGGANVDDASIGPLVVGEVGLLIPGNSPAIITTGNLTLESGSFLIMEVFGTTPGNTPTSHDQLFVRGTVDVAGSNLRVSFGTFTPALGNEFVLIANDGSDAVIGEFAGLPEGSLVAIPGGTAVTISYVGGDGNDVVLLGTEEVEADYGDAPDAAPGTGVRNYQTLGDDNGPIHLIVPELFLGAAVDADGGTSQNLTANADDSVGATPDDEDGVLDPLELIAAPGDTPSITLSATNVTGQGATLYGWIDYNQDGVFDNTTERASMTVPDGTNDGQFTLTFPQIPSNAGGTTYARFRLSTDAAAANSTGVALDGEVEDYAFLISSTVTPTGASHLDLRYGNRTGFVAEALGLDPDDPVNVIADASDRYVVASSVYDLDPDFGFLIGSHVVVSRYLSNGQLDTDFNSTGSTALSLGLNFASVNAVRADSSGKYVIAFSGSDESGDSYVGVARLTASGSLDSSFAGGTGFVSVNLGQNLGTASALTVDSTGRYVVAGTFTTDIDLQDDLLVVRFTATGVLDLTFGGGDGMVTADVSMSVDRSVGVAMDNAGRIIVAGTTDNATSNYDYLLSRFTSDGILDTTFGGGTGFVVTDVDSTDDFASGLLLDASGNLLITGTAFDGARSRLALVRYTQAGNLDTTFGDGDGIVVDDLDAGDVSISGSAATDSAGRYLITGGADFELFVARYTLTGHRDTTFGDGDGIQNSDLVESSDDIADSISIDSSGRYIVAGTTFFSGQGTDLLLARFTSDEFAAHGFSFDFAAIASDLHPTLRAFGQTSAFYSPLTIIRYGTIDLTGLAGFPNSLAAAGANPGNITLEFGSLNPSSPAEVLTLDVFDDGVSDGFGREIYRPDGSIDPFGTQPDNPTVTIYNSGVAVARGVFQELNLEFDQTGDLYSMLSTLVITQAVGADPTIFNEIMAVTGGTGVISFSLEGGSFFGTSVEFEDAELFAASGQGLDGAEIQDDHGNTTGTATAWGRMAPIAGRIAPTDDPDFFAITLDASTEYTFRTVLDSLTDSTLELLDSNGNQLAFNDDGPSGLASEIIYTTSDSGTYYLVVRGLNGSVGKYELQEVVADVIGPTLTVNIVATALDDGNDSSAVTFTFNEPVTGFDISDVSLSGGTLSNFTGSGSSYSAIFTATNGLSENGTVSVAAGTYTDLTGNEGGSGSDTVAIDTANPTLLINIVDALLNNTDNVSGVTFVFSEPVTGFDISDVVFSSGTLSNFSGSGSVYTATFTADGNIETNGFVRVLDGRYTDTAGNLGGAGSDTVAIDTRNPTLIVNVVDSLLNNTDNVSNVTFVFSEPVTGFDVGDVALSGGTLSNFSGSGSAYTATFTADANTEADGTVSVAAGSYIDLAGNNGGPGFDSVAIDTQNPTLTVNIVDSALNNLDKVSGVTFVFSEAVTGFDVSDVALSGGTLSNFSGSGSVYTATFTADNNLEDNGSVNVAAGTYTDLAGNTGGPSSDIVTIDTQRPTLTVNIVDTLLNNADKVSLVTFVFSEPVTGFAVTSVQFSGGTLSSFSGSGASYTATFTASDGVTVDGIVATEDFFDLAGNPGNSAFDSVAIDTQSPTLTITIVDASLNDSDNSSNVTFEFSESVTGFDLSDVSFSGGTLSDFSGSGASYSATFTATDGVEAVGLLSVTAGSYTDEAGNEGGSSSASVPIDTQNPTLTVNIVDASLNNADNSSLVTFEFSEVVTGFDASDVQFSGGTLSNFSGSGNSYSATFTADAAVEVTGSVTVAAGSYRDAANNSGGEGSDTVVIDTLNIGLSINIVDDSLNDADPNSLVTFVFSEAVTGFELDDVSFTGGTLSNFSGSGSSYSATFTANDGVDITGTVSVAAGTYTNLSGGNGGAGSDSVAIDTLNPTVTVTIVDTSLNDGDGESTVTIEFSEAVAGFDVSDVSFSGGTLSNFSGSGTSYSATFTATDGVETSGTVSIAAGSYTDLVGNTGASGSSSVAIDTQNPTLSLSFVDDLLNDGDADSVVTFTFSEAVTGFDISDIAFSEGMLSNFSGSGSVYTATFTANDSFEGNGSVSVAAGSYTDLAGNTGGAGSDSVAIDTQAPTLTVSIIDASLNNADNISGVTFVFSEPVTGFDVTDVAFSGGTLSNFSGSGSVYTATFTADDNSEASGIVSVAAGSYTDLAGNPGDVGSDSVAIDTQAPTLSVTIVDALLNNADNASEVTFVFSEAVLGFDISDVAFSGGVLSNFSGSGSVYTATFTADDSIDVNGTVSVAAAAYTDLAGNNGGSGIGSVTIDTQAPTLAVSIIDALLNNADNVSGVTFVFSEAVTGFDVSDVTFTGGTLSNFAGSGSVYTATFTANADIEITGMVSIAAGTYTDLAGNSGSEGSDTVSIDTLRPGAVITPDGTTTGTSPIEFTIQFSQNVVGFVAGNISVLNGTPGAFTVVDADTYLLEVAPEANGTVTVSIDAGAAQDVAGNDSGSASATVTFNAAQPVDVTLPAAGSYEVLRDGADLVLRVAGSSEILRQTAADISVLRITGTAGDDVVTVLNAGSQVDTQLVFTGNDGNDVFNASLAVAAVTLTGSGGNDTLFGGSADDVLNGGSGADELVGNAGNDFLNGQGGTGDTLDGGDGDDTLNGGSGNDVLREFFAGNAVLTNTAMTGRGSDTVVDVERALLAGGSASQTIDASAFLTPGLTSVTLDGGGGNDVLIGSPGSDVLNGAGGNDSLLGGDGHDRLLGGSGADTLNGGNGNDLLKGLGGSGDRLTGELGDDTLNGGSGIDRLFESGDVDFVLTNSSLSGLGNDVLAAIEIAELNGGDSDNVIDVSGFLGFRGFVQVRGLGGNDLIIGSRGPDILSGGDGDDTLLGKEGNDTLNGDDGNDGLSGFSGNDVINGGRGFDRAFGGQGNDTLLGGNSVDTLIGGEGDDSINGNDGVDTLVGGTGDNDASAGDVITDATANIDEAFTLVPLPGWVDQV